MIKNGNYVYGTAAEKIEYDVYTENRVLKAKKKQKSYMVQKTKAVLCLMTVFMLGTLVMYRYALITKTNFDINKQTKAYNDLVKENDRLKIKIDQSMDLQKIKEVAEAKLGMQKPEKYQINYIAVNKSDVTKISEEYSGKVSQNSVLKKIIGLLGISVKS